METECASWSRTCWKLIEFTNKLPIICYFYDSKLLECHTRVVLAQSNLFLRLQCRLHHCPAVCWALAIASNSYNLLRMSPPWTGQHQQPVRLWNRAQSSCQNLASPLPESLNFSLSFLPLCPSYLAPSTLCFIFKPLMVCSTFCGSWRPAVSFLFTLSPFSKDLHGWLSIVPVCVAVSGTYRGLEFLHRQADLRSNPPEVN